MRLGDRIPFPAALPIAFVAVLLQLGCAIGPNFTRPEVDVPEIYRETVDPSQAQSLADLPWWKVFEDPVLMGLIETALQNNLNLEIAVARTEHRAVRHRG